VTNPPLVVPGGRQIGGPADGHFLSCDKRYGLTTSTARSPLRLPRTKRSVATRRLAYRPAVPDQQYWRLAEAVIRKRPLAVSIKARTPGTACCKETGRFADMTSERIILRPVPELCLLKTAKAQYTGTLLPPGPQAARRGHGAFLNITT
jgi:hypothetical protein